MNSKITFVTNLVLLFALVSCKKSGNTESQDVRFPKTIHLNISEAITDSIDLSLIAEKVEYIPLQATDSSMLNYIDRFCITKDYFFIEEGGCVLKFDKNGQYIKRLYKIGRGPGETSTRSFTVDESSELVYVLDIYNGDVKVFDFNGNFIKSIHEPINIPKQRTASIGYFNNKLVVTTAQFPKVKILYALFDLSNYSIQKLFDNHYIYDKSQLDQRPSLIYWIDKTFQIVDSNLIVKEWFCDTIFNVDKNFRIEPKYIIDMANSKLDWLSWRDHGMFNLSQGFPSGYWIESFVETSSFLFGSLKSFKDPKLFAFIDKRNYLVKISANKYYKPGTNNQVHLKNDLDYTIAFPAMDKSGSIFYYDNCLYSIIEPIAFLKAGKSVSEKTKNSTNYLNNVAPVLSILTEFSNPVIMKVYLK
jgi:hypothetical protein